ncbi:MAG: VOC family protein [Dehalococcoidia bacterium]|nr:VOC family protein [Dehalococcoidia bacterium]
MTKPKRVGHLVLNVRDVEASTRFYTEILGFEIAVQRPNMTFLTCGKIHHDLALFKASEDSPPVSEGQVGLNHFAVQVEDLDALTETYQRLKEKGVPVDNTVDHGMTQSVYFHDPDGIRIEFFCNSTSTTEEGLALMRAPDRQNRELVLEDAPA